MLTLVDLVLTLPVHSADCERGFSHMKKVKSDWRSKLRDTTVSDCLTIILETPSIDPAPALELWMDKDRKPDTAPRGHLDDYSSSSSSTETSSSSGEEEMTDEEFAME